MIKFEMNPDWKKHLITGVICAILGSAGTLAVAGAQGWIGVGEYKEKIQTNTIEIKCIKDEEIPDIHRDISDLRVKNKEVETTVANYKESNEKTISEIKQVLRENQKELLAKIEAMGR